MTPSPLAIHHRRAAPAGARYELVLENLHECLAALATEDHARLVRDLIADLPWQRLREASPDLRLALYQAVRRALDVVRIWREHPPFPAEPSRELCRRYQAALDLFEQARRGAKGLAQRELPNVVY